MNVKMIEPKGGDVTGATAEEPNAALKAALKNAMDQGKPFVIEWRKTDTPAQSWQGDDGCGCGTSSFN